MTCVCIFWQAKLEKSVVLNFIQLRSDYKTIKLTNSLKGIMEGNHLHRL